MASTSGRTKRLSQMLGTFYMLPVKYKRLEKIKYDYNKYYIK
jgi:hypothetical protein